MSRIDACFPLRPERVGGKLYHLRLAAWRHYLLNMSGARTLGDDFVLFDLETVGEVVRRLAGLSDEKMAGDVQLVEFAGFGPEISAVIISGSVFGACCLCISLVQFVRWLKYRHDNALDTSGRVNRVNVTYESTYWVRHGTSWCQLGEHWQCIRALSTCLLSALLLWVVR